MKKNGIFIFLGFIFLFSCTARENKTKSSKEIVDVLGRKVLVPEQVDRLVALRAGTLRLLCYLDAKKMIVGIEEGEKRAERLYLNLNPDLKELPGIGPMMSGDAERIMLQNPDVIFISYTTIEDANELQRKTNIPVVAIDYPELASRKEDLFKTLGLIGQILQKEERADSLKKFINEHIDMLDKRTKNETKKPVVYVGGIPYSGSHGITSTQPFYPPFLFTHANAPAAKIDERIISHIKGTYIDVEQLIEWNPDVLFIDHSGLTITLKDIKRNKNVFDLIHAMQENQLYSLFPYNNYATNYEYALINSWFVGKVLSPKSFEDVDMIEKANEILSFFYGKKVLWQEKDLLVRKIDKSELDE